MFNVTLFILQVCYEEKVDIITTSEDTTYRFTSYVHYYNKDSLIKNKMGRDQTASSGSV